MKVNAALVCTKVVWRGEAYIKNEGFIIKI